MSSLLDHPTRVLFLCTGNSCRSIIGEALLNHLGGDRWEGFSAGSRPTGQVHPGALDILASKGVKTTGYVSKSWDTLGDISFDLVITVCDNAAAETCPYFVGRGIKAHWGLPDPAYAEKKEEAFQNTFSQLQVRITELMDLPLNTLSDLEIKERVNYIGRKAE
eukprot:GFUD01016800.1.p1 GENE.GFUD01016800.1~~GFUD01016800.1.p1  ORF type:complete len:163 (-),score=44.56 GFUD01016800.1:102-590(-)